MPTITTDDGSVFDVPEPIRQDLALPLPAPRDEWSDDPDRTTRNNDTRTSEQVTAEAFSIGTRVRTIMSVWHGYTHPRGVIGTVTADVTGVDGEPHSYQLDTGVGRIDVWPWEIEAV